MLGAALHKPPAGFADIPISRRSRSGPLWAAPVLPLMVPSSRRTVPGNDAFHGAKSRRQGPCAPCSAKWHTVIGRGDVPPPGKGPAAPGEGPGSGNEHLARHPFPRGPGRQREQRDLPPCQLQAGQESLHPLRRGLGPAALQKVIGAQHHDQQVGVRRNVRCRVGELPAVGAPVAQHPSGFGRQDVHPSAARGTAPAQPGLGIVAPGAGIGETDDLPHSCPSKAQAPDVPSPSPHPV